MRWQKIVEPEHKLSLKFTLSISRLMKCKSINEKARNFIEAVAGTVTCFE